MSPFTPGPVPLPFILSPFPLIHKQQLVGKGLSLTAQDKMSRTLGRTRAGSDRKPGWASQFLPTVAGTVWGAARSPLQKHFPPGPALTKMALPHCQEP